jgi:uncharacterized protein (DUF1330 family)
MEGEARHATAELESAMTVYVIARLKMTDRAAYDRYQARFFEVFRKFSGRLLSADESPSVVEGDWNRDKLVLMSFPDEAAYHAERIFRLSGSRLAARKCAQSNNLRVF